jgi:hypothetical protein
MRKQRQERDRQCDQQSGVGGEFGDLERDDGADANRDPDPDPDADADADADGDHHRDGDRDRDRRAADH